MLTSDRRVYTPIIIDFETARFIDQSYIYNSASMTPIQRGDPIDTSSSLSIERVRTRTEQYDWSLDCGIVPWRR